MMDYLRTMKYNVKLCFYISLHFRTKLLLTLSGVVNISKEFVIFNYITLNCCRVKYFQTGCRKVIKSQGPTK